MEQSEEEWEGNQLLIKVHVHSVCTCTNRGGGQHLKDRSRYYCVSTCVAAIRDKVIASIQTLESGLHTVHTLYTHMYMYM